MASQLRLPANGPFVVVAAEVPAVGIEALPEIESKLRGRDVYSVWRLQPDLQVGIVHVKSERRLDEILGLVSRLTTNRVGVSARFDDLHDTPQALHFAKVMLRGRPHQASPIAVFDGSILATAAVSAPDVMAKLVRTVLVGFDDLPDAEREILFETFRVWQESDASRPERSRGAYLPSQHRAPSTAPDRATHQPISRAQEMSPSYVWLSRCAAGSCSHSDDNACYLGKSPSMRSGAIEVDRATSASETTRIQGRNHQIHWSVMNGFCLTAENCGDHDVGVGDGFVLSRGGDQSDCHRPVPARTSRHRTRSPRAVVTPRHSQH